MAIVLPTSKTPPTRKSPKTLILYSAPKVGKTTLLSQLENCLIADLEDGAAYVEAMKITLKNVDQFDEFCTELRNKIVLDKKYPYLYGALDTTTKLEEWVEAVATQDYRSSTVGKNFPAGSSVLTLPEGAGYLWLRRAFQRYITNFCSLFPRVILVGHLKEKLISSGVRSEDLKVTDKDKAVKLNDAVMSTDIDLTGKIRNITAANADAICYLYRNTDGKLIGSFKSVGTTAGARCEHLRNVAFEFDWNKVYVD